MNTKSTNLDGYGTPPIAWEKVREVLTSEIAQAPDTGGPNRHSVWLTTINPDGYVLRYPTVKQVYGCTQKATIQMTFPPEWKSAAPWCMAVPIRRRPMQAALRWARPRFAASRA